MLIVDKGDFPEEGLALLNSYIKTSRDRKALKNFLAKSSQDDKGLQAADFVVGAIFQKLERGDDRYFSIIEPKIKQRLLLS